MEMEDNLNFRKLEYDFIIWQIEDDLNIFTNERHPKFSQMEETLIFSPMAYEINELANGR